MPDLDGLELLRAIKAEWPSVPVIMLSTYENAPYVKRALADGAAGYLLKDATPEDLSQAINVAMSGSGNVLSPRVIQNLFEDQESGAHGGSQNGRRSEYSLTQREHDILALLSEGRSNREIARSAVPEREDGQGAPRRDLPQAGRHQPDPGRDDGRPDGGRTHAGRVGQRIAYERRAGGRGVGPGRRSFPRSGALGRYRWPFRAFSAFSAILARTTFLTSADGIGASTVNRIVPLPDR